MAKLARDVDRLEHGEKRRKPWSSTASDSISSCLDSSCHWFHIEEDERVRLTTLRNFPSLKSNFHRASHGKTLHKNREFPCPDCACRLTVFLKQLFSYAHVRNSKEEHSGL